MADHEWERVLLGLGFKKVADRIFKKQRGKDASNQSEKSSKETGNSSNGN